MTTFYYKLDEIIENTLNSGDPEIRTWFLVKQNTLPIFLCGIYVIFVTMIGPAIMKNRKPFTLRKPMIIFNLFLVVAYTVSIFIIFTNLQQVSWKEFCKGSQIRKGDVNYRIAQCYWVLYILKYIEFVDTILFVLRKKYNLITVLHVVHHTIVPIIVWVLLRTEISGFQTIPGLINSVVHIIMYSYYGLAAIGPHMKKYLWWKKYLTILQMVQFVIIIFFMAVIVPLTDCSIGKTRICLDIGLGTGFLMLFYNFYVNTFNRKDKNV